MVKKYIYLDNASTTPLSKNVLNKINSTYKKYWSNSSSTYKYGIKCATYLEKIRVKIANIFNAKNFVCNLEKAYKLIWNNFKNGKKIADIYL